MNPWIIILLSTAATVFVLDFLIRRKKWKNNTKEEKISLIINMFSVGPHIFLSALGMLWGIVSSSPKTAFGKMLNDVTLMMGTTYFIVAIVAVILSLVFRKTGKVKASIWINIIAFVYIVAVLVINSFVGNLL